MTNWVDKQCRETVYLTPPEIVSAVTTYFGGDIPLDPATQADNPVHAKTFFTELDNGLQQPWKDAVFVNPPYGKVFPLWVAKIGEEAERGQEILALLPCGARFSTKYWQRWMLIPHLKNLCFIRKRVKFLRPDGTIAPQNPYDSQILGFNTDSERFIRALFWLGKCMKIEIPQEIV